MSYDEIEQMNDAVWNMKSVKLNCFFPSELVVAIAGNWDSYLGTAPSSAFTPNLKRQGIDDGSYFISF